MMLIVVYLMGKCPVKSVIMPGNYLLNSINVMQRKYFTLRHTSTFQDNKYRTGQYKSFHFAALKPLNRNTIPIPGRIQYYKAHHTKLIALDCPAYFPLASEDNRRMILKRLESTGRVCLSNHQDSFLSLAGCDSDNNQGTLAALIHR